MLRTIIIRSGSSQNEELGNAYIIDKPNQAHTEESPPVVFNDKQVRNFNVFHALPVDKCQLRLIEQLRLITS
jgi:hypothetical protein